MYRQPILTAILAGAFVIPASAQDDYGDNAHGVSRISVINGDVSVKRGDSGDLVAAAVNAPLMGQDHLLTGPASRAEIQFDFANAIRIGASSEVRLGELGYNRYQVQVAVGTTTFRVLRQNRSQVEVATPSVAVRPLGPGIYRVSVFEDGSSEITVRSGAVEVYTPHGSQRVETGQTLLARGSPQDPEFQINAAIPVDDWDRYNEERDQEVERSRSSQYVSPDVTGAEDLDRYGRWDNVAPYGQVWVPSVDPGWAPYRYGRWSWTDWYGWTWVSYDPWGWAPYHYGRWFWGGPRGWCWYPGGYVHQYWSPALVAFFGFGGGGVGVGFGFGNVGWVPLAPFEPFHHWWGPGYYGRTNITNVTIVNNTNITNIYRNARVVNGVSAVAATDFGRARITNGNLIRVGQGEIARANLVRGPLPVAPGRESLSLSDRSVRTANLPRANPNERFFSRMQTQPVQRIPFEQQRQNAQAMARRTFGNTAPAGSSAPQAAGRGGWPRTGQAPQSAEPSGSRPIAPPSGELHQPSDPSQPARGGNWRRFGEPAPYRSTPQSNTYHSPEPAPRYEPPARSSTPGASYDGGYQRFGQTAPQYQSAPYGGQSNSRLNSGGGWPARDATRMSAPAPVRISPPIVKQRSTPSYSAPRSGGGEHRPAPPSRGSESGGSHSRR
jgi:hypothetical protein